MESSYDVIVIGAGFAGATAARECATRGLRTLVLEGRDRVGGRTWTSRLSDGELVELGGTYVHWLQPHVWSEITRYGLEGDVVTAGEALEWALAPKGEGLEWCTIAEHLEREKPLLERFFEPSAALLPRPYDPLSAGDAIADWDQLSVRDRLDQMELSPEDDALLTSLFTVYTGEALADSSFLSMLRGWAPAGHTYDARADATFGYKLANGTVSLIEAMFADGGAELRLSSPVAKVTSDDGGVAVTTTGGETFAAAVAVVATPAGVWPHLDVSPPLSEERLAAARGGLQVPRGSKAVAVIRGERRRFSIHTRVGHPIGTVWTSHKRSEDEQVVVIFGSPTMKDASDADEVTAALEDLLPHVDVSEVVSGTYHEDDELARGGWPFPRLGQLTRFAPHERLAREGRLVFATADLSKLWVSFIDGAIESGLRAGRDVREILAGSGLP